MRRPTACLAVAALALSACAPGPRGARGRDLAPAANPSAVIAAELGFARTAQEKGQWTAFADYAADGAVMFVPEPVAARDWLKKQQNPPRSVTWQPHQVWSSCDGSLAVTRGAWQRPDGTGGYFTTVWRRQRNGELKWVLDQGDTLAEPPAAPEMIGAQVADCRTGVRERPAGGQPAMTTDAAGVVSGAGQADDGTLSYRFRVGADHAREVVVLLLKDGTMREAVRSEVAAP